MFGQYKMQRDSSIYRNLLSISFLDILAGSQVYLYA